MSKYQITLTPVDKFFFGGDMTFQVGNNENDEFNKKYSSYIIKSSMYPQQTSLLGMLRFLILRNGGNAVFKDGRIVDNELAKELIGKRSFSVNDNHEENQFGMIGSLTHVWIRKTEKGKEENLEFEPFFRELSFNKSGLYNLQGINIPEIPKEEYDPKDGIKTRLTGDIELKDVFKEDRRIGIDRDIKTGKTGEKGDHALFKQISYRFAIKVENKGDNKEKDNVRYCFVFNAVVDDCIPLENYSGQLVTVGGDNSQFVIGISKDVRQQDVAKQINNAVYLLSPTYLSPEEAREAKFAITQVMPFRFLKTEVDKDVSYNIINKGKNKSLNRSKKFELYAPGSVFYFKDKEQKQKFIEYIESKKEFRQIGYNEFK